MHKQEDHHHSPEQIEGYVTEAVRIADEAQLSDADRAALLPGIMGFLATKQIFYQQAQPIPPGHHPVFLGHKRLP